MRIPPQRIVLSGGGVRVLSHVGSLVALHEHKLLKNVKEWSGVSAGAFLATLCSSGYSIEELKKLKDEVDFTEIPSENPDSLFDFFTTYGLDSGDGLNAFIERYLNKKGFTSQTTFQTLFDKTGIRLRMWATNLKTRKPVEFSTYRTPKFSISKALRASMALPIIFTPYHDQKSGIILVDGGCLGNYPIEHLLPVEQENSLGITFCEGKQNLDEDEDSMLTFFRKCISIYQSQVDLAHMRNHSERTIFSPCGEFPSWKFDITPEERKMLYQTGYEAANTFLNTSQKNDIYSFTGKIRRWSVS